MGRTVTVTLFDGQGEPFQCGVDFAALKRHPIANRILGRAQDKQLAASNKLKVADAKIAAMTEEERAAHFRKQMKGAAAAAKRG